MNVEEKYKIYLEYLLMNVIMCHSFPTTRVLIK